MRLQALVEQQTPLREDERQRLLAEARCELLLELGSDQREDVLEIPIATPATKATGMLLRLAMAAAVMPAMSSVVKLRVFGRIQGVLTGQEQDP